MTKSEDDTANDVDDATTEARVEPVTEVANAPKTGRHGWRRRSAAPRNVPEVESKAEESTVEESTLEAPNTEATVETPAAETVVVPRIRGAAADEEASAAEDAEPTPLEAADP